MLEQALQNIFSRGKTNMFRVNKWYLLHARYFVGSDLMFP